MELGYQVGEMSNTKRELILHITDLLVKQELLTLEEKIKVVNELNEELKM